MSVARFPLSPMASTSGVPSCLCSPNAGPFLNFSRASSIVATASATLSCDPAWMRRPSSRSVSTRSAGLYGGPFGCGYSSAVSTARMWRILRAFRSFSSECPICGEEWGFCQHLVASKSSLRQSPRPVSLRGKLGRCCGRWRHCARHDCLL